MRQGELNETHLIRGWNVNVVSDTSNGQYHYVNISSDDPKSHKPIECHVAIYEDEIVICSSKAQPVHIKKGER